jgi:hypothetical protein
MNNSNTNTNNTIIKPTPLQENGNSMMILGYKMDFYSIGFIILFIIYYVSFFIYGGYSFSKIEYLWYRLVSPPKKTSGNSVQKGTKWSIQSL